jgi:hypothetical protein
MSRLGIGQRLELLAALVVAVGSALIWVGTGNVGGDLLGAAFALLVAGANVAWWSVGAVILARARVPRIGWLLMVAAVAGVIAMASYAILQAGGFGPGGSSTSPNAAWAFLALSAAYGPWFASLVLASMVLFPDGRLPGRWWRLPVILAILAIAASTVSRLVAPGPLAPGMPDNPLGVEALAGLPYDALAALDPLGIATLALIGMAALIVRYRAAGPVVRQQLKWLVAAVIPAALATPVAFFEPNSTTTSLADLIQMTAITVLMPLAIGIAVTRYRLYEIDRLISRTIGWAIVTGILVAVFAGLVVLLQALLAPVTNENAFAVAASTLIAFALFQPVRRRVQRAVDRRFDRARYDGEQIIAVFAARLRDQVDLGSLEGEIASVANGSVRPASAAVWLRKARTTDTARFS